MHQVGHNHMRLVQAAYSVVGAIPSRWLRTIQEHHCQQLICHGMRGPPHPDTVFSTFCGNALVTHYNPVFTPWKRHSPVFAPSDCRKTVTVVQTGTVGTV